MRSKLTRWVKWAKTAFIVASVYLVVSAIFLQTLRGQKVVNLSQLESQINTAYYPFLVKDVKSIDKKNFPLRAKHVLTCIINGKGCETQNEGKNFQNSLMGRATQFMLIPYAAPPASGIASVQSSLAQAGFIPKVVAAEGIGFASIKPLVGLWKAMRNIAYLLLVLVMITIGFMIMFRSKVNPQTVVKVENALPKIVMSLIYITFSFAIAGLLIDLMYISTAIIISVLVQSDVKHTALEVFGIPLIQADKMNVQDVQSAFLTSGPGKLWDGLMGNSTGALSWHPMKILWDLPNALLGLVPALGILLKTIGGIVGAFVFIPWLYNTIFDPVKKLGIDFGASLFGLVSGTVKGTVEFGITAAVLGFTTMIAVLMGLFALPLIIGLLMLITVAIIFFRLIFLMIGAYIKIMLYIIIGPIYLLLEAIPGRSAFGPWIKNLIGELVIFPTVVTLFIFSLVLVSNAAGGTLISFPFLFGIDPKSLGLIIGMWFIFSIPELTLMVQKMINPKPLPLDAGLGTFFGGVTQAVGAGTNEMHKYAMISPYIKPLDKVFSLLKGGGKGGGHGP